MNSTQHQHGFFFGADGDYILYERLGPSGWVEISRWLIPGSEFEVLT